jgi:hypothetical protein
MVVTVSSAASNATGRLTRKIARHPKALMKRERCRQLDRCPDALQCAETDQFVGRGRERAQSGPECEDSEPNEIDALVTRAVADPSAAEQQARKREDVAVHDPLKAAGRGVQAA